MALAEKLNHTDVNAAFPTLVLSECVLVYLKPEESKVILSFFRDYFKGDIALLNYEMINPHDPFGKTMLENLEVNYYFLNRIRIEDADFREFMKCLMRQPRIKEWRSY